MSENYVDITLTLSNPQLDDEDLQAAVQNLQQFLEEIEGIREVSLIPEAEASPGAKSIGGFLLDKLKAVVNLKNLATLVKALGNRLFSGATIEIEAEGNGRTLKLKVSRPEDVEPAMNEVNKFING